MDLNCLKKYYLFLFTLILVISCSKEDGPPIPENSVFKPQTELISLTGKNNQLKLTWKPVVIKGFKSYKIYRLDKNTDEFMNPNIIVYTGELIFQSSDYLKSSYEDNQVPFNSFIGYAVVTEYLNENNQLITATSINCLFYENQDLSFKITSLEKLADGSFKLTWEKDTNTDFENYTISVFSGGYIISSEEIIKNGKTLKVHTNQEDNTIIDASQYTDEKICFAVSKIVKGKKILSKNSVSVGNPRILDFKPGQTLKNPYNENEIIIVNNTGEIIFYDINSLTSKKIITTGEIFFCSIAKFNGVYDLYIPSSNGKVYVVDLNTYQIKETIFLITDYNILTAIPINNQLLFIEKHAYADIGGMFVYDRINKKVLNRDGSYGTSSNSKLINAKDNYFFDVWNDGIEYGSDSAIREFNLNGNQVKIDFTFDDCKADSRLFALSDDKTFFISSKYGYQSTINYQNISEVTTGRYSETPIFSDAKISENNHIFFAVPDESRIVVFEKDNFNSPINQYETIGKPVAIELINNRIISLSQIENRYFIETISK